MMNRRTLLKGSLAAVATAAAPVWASAVAGPAIWEPVGVVKTMRFWVKVTLPPFAPLSTSPAASAIWQQVHKQTWRQAGLYGAARCELFDRLLDTPQPQEPAQE